MKRIYCSDFDGTLVKGDITEGSSYYIGIVELLYQLNLVTSEEYPTYQIWRNEYDSLLAKNNTQAFLMPLLIYDQETMYPVIVEYWKTTISKYFVKYTRKRLIKQSKKGQVWIVSASPSIFIKPLMNYLPISKIIGIEIGKPISYGIGKIERLRLENVLNKVQAFTGDSWNNDGPIMAYVCNNRTCPDVVYIEHGQTDSNNLKNLQRYPITIIDAY
jgi:phosphoserine phosphatase